MRIYKWKFFAAVNAGFLFAAAAFAQDRGRSDRTNPSANDARGNSSSKQPFHVERATTLIGKRVVDQRGESMGKVEELVIDPDNEGRVSYAIVSSGDSAGSNKRTAVPFTALRMHKDGKQFTMNLSDEQRRSLPSFEQDGWPTMDDPAWATRTHEFFGQEPYWTGDGRRTPSGSDVRLRSNRAREIIGRSVQNSRGENLGRVEDFAIDPSTGRIAYNILSLDGARNSTNQYYAVPSSSLEYPATGRSIVFDVETDRLQDAPGFERNRWPNLSDPTYASSVHNYYGKQAYWIDNNQDPNTRTNATNTGNATPGSNATDPSNTTRRPNNPSKGQTPTSPKTPDKP